MWVRGLSASLNRTTMASLRAVMRAGLRAARRRDAHVLIAPSKTAAPHSDAVMLPDPPSAIGDDVVPTAVMLTGAPATGCGGENTSELNDMSPPQLLAMGGDGGGCESAVAKRAAAAMSARADAMEGRKWTVKLRRFKTQNKDEHTPQITAACGE